MATKGLPLPKDVPQAYFWDTTVKGLGVVVGKTGQKTFVVYSRLAGERGKRVKHKIGVHGQPRDDKHVWTGAYRHRGDRTHPAICRVRA